MKGVPIVSRLGVDDLNCLGGEYVETEDWTLAFNMQNVAFQFRL